MRQLAPVALLLAVAATARAQDCAEGRERIDGFCCWPGQTFSTAERRCEGPPRCPEAFAEHGEACVLRAVASSAPPPLPVALPTSEASLAIPPGYTATAGSRHDEAPAPITLSAHAWPAAHEGSSLSRAVHVQGRDEPLIAVAFALFDAGWAMGWVGALVDEAVNGCHPSCASWPLAFIPLGGGAAAVTADFSSGSRSLYLGTSFGIVSVILQGVGLVAAAIAVENRTSEIAFRRGALPTESLSIRLVPSAPGALAGLSIAGSY